ncbi:MAG: nucleotidyltransferase domain-containing protein [Candidatus Competibacteraceae bacterium]|nr:MAG: nucleotidyltransferase domain-containing protein [Candidatus Competibacteraceae bacterium]
MRLTEQQRNRIREAGLRHFGVVPYLFGSRLDDTGRGGDIDLFIPGNWSTEEAVHRRLRFCAELRRCLGDQKIDVVVENKKSSSIQSQAKLYGEPV